MDIHEYSQLSDEELLVEQKKLKSFSIINALIIGFFIGIIFYSIIKNTWGLFTIIPLFFIYKMINDPRNKKARALDKLIKERKINN